MTKKKESQSQEVRMMKKEEKGKVRYLALVLNPFLYKTPDPDIENQMERHIVTML